MTALANAHEKPPQMRGGIAATVNYGDSFSMHQLKRIILNPISTPNIAYKVETQKLGK